MPVAASCRCQSYRAPVPLVRSDQNGHPSACCRNGSTITSQATMTADQPRRPGGIDVKLELSGQVAVVTGAGAGIGRACAEALAQAGAAVVASDRAAPASEATAEAIIAAGGT